MDDDAGSSPRPALELWGGVECTVNRVHGRYHDQCELTGHASRPGDLERIAALGIRRLRYPVLWERVAPTGVDRIDWRWADARLATLRALGIAPIAGLVHHGSGPRDTSLADPRFAHRLAEFAGAVARRFPWIDAYTPINEPLTTARFSALYGHWYPHAKSDAAFVSALIQQCRATALGMQAIRAVNPSARLVQTDDAGKTYSTPVLAYQAEFDNHRRWLAWDLLCGRVDRDHPLWQYLLGSGASERDLGWFADHPCPPDVIALNYYLTSDRFLDERVDRHPGVHAGGNGRHIYVDVEAVRVCPTISGHAAILREAWERYGRPVAIGEVHLGCSREEQLRWLVEAWDGAHSARRSGAHVEAVTAWALFGMCDWTSLVTTLRGHYEPGAYDVRGSEPRPTALADLIRQLTAGRNADHPTLASDGWWRREGRTHVSPPADSYPRGFPPAPALMRSRRRSAGRHGIVVTGAAGTLGHAFSRICAARGLVCAGLRRQDLDVTDAADIAGALDRLRPWAVVNAAGYVRVDEAQEDADRCTAVNARGPALLGEACARRGIRLVTFSSDLVFDGAAGRPYTESDLPRPLSVYGRSKADAERLVLAACPGALVVRTSAFFSPWDSWNTVHLALEAIAAGHRWQPEVDQRISPTYVPDLVDATLDLLIDGAGGVWHLANSGDVSWADLIATAAALCGYPRDRVDLGPIEPGRTRARRPRYSVLGTERGQLLPPLDDALRRYVAGRIEEAATISGEMPADRDRPAV